MKSLLPLLCLGFSVPALASDLENVVKIDSGYVLGSGTAVRVYKGIPFAAPPVGELRWQAPQPVTPWDSIRVSKTFSLSCPQPPVAVPQERIGEDCLTINVWTPGPCGERPAARARFDLRRRIRRRFGLAELVRRGTTCPTGRGRRHLQLSRGHLRFPGSPGAQQRVAAGNLRQLCVARHGGGVAVGSAQYRGLRGRCRERDDLGESAGGTAVGHLLVVPQAQGLFHKAIMNSPWSMYYPINRLREARGTRPSAEERGAAFGSLAALRAKSADELMQLSMSALPGTATIDPDQGGQAFRPIVDGVVLPDDPAALFAKGAFHHVPLIAGTNADEGVLFAPRGIATREQADEWLRAQLGSEAARRDRRVVWARCRRACAGRTHEADRRCALRNGNACDAARGSSLQPERVSVRVHARQPSCESHETERVPWRRSRVLVRNIAGVGAESVIPGFTVSPGDYDEKDEQVSRAMSGAIVQFAKTGDPNGRGLPKWSRFGSDENYLEYGDSFVQKQELRSAYLDALDAIFAAKRSADSAR